MEIDISIEAVVEQAGINIKRKGSTLMALCPFHDDKRPSMAVYPDKQRFICFACGEKGSPVDFVMKHQNITFKEAVKRLNGNGSQRFIKRKPRNPDEERFKRWRKEYFNRVSLLLRGIRRILATKYIKGRWQMERAALIFHALPILEYHFEVLTDHDLEVQKELYSHPEWQY